jgi:hypothetical protein
MPIVGMEIKAVRWRKEMCHCTLVRVRHGMLCYESESKQSEDKSQVQ